MTSSKRVIEKCIFACQQWLQDQDVVPRVHFEVEGMVSMSEGRGLDFSAVNRDLKRLGIPGELKKEYWPGQWEYVSDMAGQSPVQEAQFVHRIMFLLPELFKAQGALKTWLDPVVWHGSKQRYAAGSDSIFAQQTGSVHIPNAIQINVSAHTSQGENLMPDSGLGEWLQYQLLKTSYACCLLYLPEPLAFERLALRTFYGLDTELSSPWELSGGYKGSIALYKDKGKHDQPMGLKTLVLGPDYQPLSSEENWQATSRVEHRLGATSIHYDPFVNVLFILLNLINAIEAWRQGKPAPQYKNRALPASLKDKPENNDEPIGALSLFRKDTWFSSNIDEYCQNVAVSELHSTVGLGEMIKQRVLDKYLPVISV